MMNLDAFSSQQSKVRNAMQSSLQQRLGTKLTVTSKPNQQNTSAVRAPVMATSSKSPVMRQSTPLTTNRRAEDGQTFATGRQTAKRNQKIELMSKSPLTSSTQGTSILTGQMRQTTQNNGRANGFTGAVKAAGARTSTTLSTQVQRPKTARAGPAI